MSNNLLTMELDWQKSQRIPIGQLLSIFPEAEAIINRNINIFTLQKQKLLADIAERLKDIEDSVPEEKQWLIVGFFKHLSPLPKAVIKLNQYIKLLCRYRRTINQIKSKIPDFSLAIDYARNVPIDQIVTPILQRVKLKGRKIIALCPFHQEKTPSFYVYKDQNKYHCFGCQEHGDVITFIIKYYELTFVEAVRYLQDY